MLPNVVGRASHAGSSIACAVGLFASIFIVVPQLGQKRCPAWTGVPHCEQKRENDWSLPVATCLHLIERGVLAAPGHEFGVASRFDDATAIQHQNLVGHPYG